MKQKKKAPVEKGQILQLDIDNINHDGEGVGRYQNFTVFVPGAVPGETVAAKVISVQKSYARALLQSVNKSSPARISPVCEHYETCGGCQLQHLAYAQQLKLKEDIVRDTLKRIGGLEPSVRPTIGMSDPWRYRNKAQVPVGFTDGTVRAGFYAKRSHNIVDLTCCHIQHPANDHVVHTVRSILSELAIPIYNEKTRKGIIRHIMARVSFATGEVLIILITNGRSLPRQDELISRLRKSIENLCGIVQNINTRPGNIILGNTEHTLWGKPYLTEKLSGLTFHISPRSFFQVNPVQTEVLYSKAKEFAALTGTETVFDLYCGIGTISLYLAESAGKVIGVESVPAAVSDARHNAELNHVKNAEFHAGLAEEVVLRLFKEGCRADVVVVDPPRKGCDEALLATMVNMNPNRIVYISCNPATLARDLKYLAAHGFHLVEVQPVDMFPHTAHVECVVLMSRTEKYSV
ncbi:MAG: 23S rRNA (uracil(1939)-C(5))-methyltransferase RlmD [Bacillota bacterium]|nr:23S rRNA (uracil(1939)-C(5))-methyltransferase RlmD [Bacillota bacterium]MDW7685373.1 23S rRNA (uracil(1939)-C(5))-methyltransferase RlmD [Bacillota bacterium]